MFCHDNRTYHYYLIVLILAFVPKISSAQWEPFNLLGEPVLYKAIHVSADTFYVSGGDGFYRTFNAGSNWTKSEIRTVPVGLKDMFFFNSKIGLGVGEIGGGNSATVAKTFDGGQTWSLPFISNSNSYPREINDIEFIDNLNGYAVGTNKIVLKTIDGGNNWIGLTPEVENENIAIKMKSINDGYIVSPRFIQGFNGQSITGTATWLADNTFIGLEIIDDNNLIAVSTDKVSKSSNRGISWTHIPFPYSGINTMFVLSPQVIYLGTDNGVYISSDGGVNWEVFKETYGKEINTIAFNSEGKGLALSNNGIAFKTNNFGGAAAPIVHFELQHKQYCNLSSLVFSATNPQSNYSYKWLLDNEVVSSNSVDSVEFTSNANGSLALVINNGVISDTLIKSYNVFIIDVKANAGPDIFACSNEPIQLSATGGGLGYYFNWSPSTGLSSPIVKNPIASGTSTAVYIVSVSSDFGECISRDTIVVFRDFPVPKLDFQKVNSSLDDYGGLLSLIMASDSVGYSFDGSSLHKTIDGGLNWFKKFTTINSRTYGDAEFSSPSTGYFGAYQLYKTTDGGNTAVPLPAYEVVDIEFVTPSIGYIANIVFPFVHNAGSILRTNDGGATWTNVYQLQGRIDKIKCFKSGRCAALGYEIAFGRPVRFLYSDDGINWRSAIHENKVESLESTKFRDITILNDSIGYAIGGRYVWKTIDAGYSWKVDYDLPLASFIEFMDNQNGFAASWSQGLLYRTLNGGVCWENIGHMDGINDFIKELYISKDKKIFIITEALEPNSLPLIQVADFKIKSSQNITFDLPLKQVGDPDFVLDATVDSGLPVTYSIENSDFVDLLEGNMIRIKSAGNINITATAPATSIYNQASVTRTLEITPLVTDVKPEFQSSRLHPNPANKYIMVDLSEFMNSKTNISIFDLIGKVHYNAQSNNELIKIDISSFASGVYFLRINNEQKSISLRFHKQ